MGNRRRSPRQVAEQDAYESEDSATYNKRNRSNSRGRTASAASTEERKPVKMNVIEAEKKLFDVNLGYDVKLRIPFQEPPKTMAEDVFVMGQVSLERGKQDPGRLRLAEAAAKHSVINLRQHFSAVAPEGAKLHLRLYVVDCYAGDREARIMSPGSGIGAARVCMVWILCLPDGSVVLDGGRVGMTDDHWMGIWDLLYLKSGERTLINGLVPSICNGVKTRIDIQSQPTWSFGFL